MVAAASAPASSRSGARGPLTLARIQDIQLECCADDIAMPDPDAMSHWSESAVRAFFESGGETLPTEAECAEAAAAPTPAAGATVVSLTAEATELLRAAETGDEQRVRDLLLHSREHAPVGTVDAHGRFPLLLAAQNGHEGTVKALLQNRANPSQAEGFTLRRSALMAASVSGHEPTVRALMIPHL